MPKDFDKCVKRGGRVRTVSAGEEYFHMCYDKEGSHKGYTKKKKSSKRKGK